MSHLFRLPAWGSRRLRSRRCLSVRRSVNCLLGVQTPTNHVCTHVPRSNDSGSRPPRLTDKSPPPASSPDLRRKTFTIFFPVITFFPFERANPSVLAFQVENQNQRSNSESEYVTAIWMRALQALSLSLASSLNCLGNGNSAPNSLTDPARHACVYYSYREGQIAANELREFSSLMRGGIPTLCNASLLQWVK